MKAKGKSEDAFKDSEYSLPEDARFPTAPLSSELRNAIVLLLCSVFIFCLDSPFLYCSYLVISLCFLLQARKLLKCEYARRMSV